MSCDPNVFGGSVFGGFHFGAGSGTNLDDLEGELYEVIRSTLPPEFFNDGCSDEEIWYAYSKIFGLVRKQVIDPDLARTYILKATGIWLDLHAKDRGTARQVGETDPQLRARIRNYGDNITRQAVIDATTAVLVARGITIPTGYPGLVELRREKVYYHALGATAPNGYWGRGRRWGDKRSILIVILPVGSASSVLAVQQAIYKIKGAGIIVIVEAYDGGTPLY